MAQKKETVEVDESITKKIAWVKRHGKSWAMTLGIIAAFFVVTGESILVWDLFPDSPMMSRLIGTTTAVVGSTVLALFVLLMVMTALFEVEWIQSIIFPYWDECEDIIQKWKDRGSERMSQDDLNVLRSLVIGSLGRAFICGIVLNGLLTPWSG